MFRLITFLLFITTAAYGQGQFELVSGHNNYLFEKESNPVKIILDGKLVNPKNWDIKIDGGTFTKTDSCIWVTIDERKVVITITDKQGKVTTSKIFSAMMLPLPHILLDGKMGGGSITKYDLLSAKGFIGVPSSSFGASFGIWEKVLSYYVKIQLGNETRSLECHGPLLNDTLKSIFKKLKPYDRVEFSFFKLDDYRKVYSPVVFEITEYHPIRYALSDLLSESFTQYQERQSIVLPYEIPGFRYGYYDTFPRIIETNCNSLTDTCSMSVYYVINNTKALTYRYYFQGNDSIRVNFFYRGALLANIGYWKKHLCGPFSIFYPNGNMRQEGEFKISNAFFHDTVLVINPMTLQEEYMSEPLYKIPVPHGVWQYYDEGIPLKTIWYQDGKVLDEKKYYTGKN